ncbi:MAG: Ig-like domain-containing protein, partial [Bradyrhizobium sp.]
MLKTWLGQETGQRNDEGEHGVESPVMFETLEPRVLMNASPVGQVTQTNIASSTQPVVVQDVNGTQLTVSLSGHGSWQITQRPNGLQLTVTGTDANSQLTLTTSPPGSHHGSGGDSDDQHSSAPHFLLNSIDIKGAIGAVSGQDVDVQGNFTAEGAIGAVSLGDFKANSQFNLLSSSPTSDIDLGNVTDLSFAAAGFIGNLEVESWISDGNAPSQITGTGIGRLSSEGNFGASLSLSGAQQTASNGKGNGNGNGEDNDGDSDGQTLGSVSVGGQISGGLWYVVGNTGAISAGSVAQSWDGDFTSSVEQISTYGDFDGQIATPRLEDLQVGGNLSHALLLIGADLGADGKLGGTGANADHFGQGELDQLSVGGSVIASRIRVGVDPVDGTLDDGTNTLIGGAASDIDQFSVEGTLDSATSIVAGAFPHQASIDDQRINPLADGHFHTSPIDLRPTLTAQLVNDTGTSATDGVTSVDTVAGKVVAADGIGKLVAGFDGETSSAFADITKQINADGTFTLTPALLAQIAGGTLADGVRTLHLVATDVFGNARAVDVHFTLATKAPSITAHLAHDTGTSATDGVTSDDTISGSVTAFTDAIVKLTGGLDSASASTFADLTKAINPDGSFTLTPPLIAQIAGGLIADGPHTLHLTATDQAGNTTAFALTFTLDTASPGITVTSAPPSVINNPGFTITGTVASTDAKFGDTVTLTAQLAGQKGTPLAIALTNGGFSLTAAQIASLAGATKLADGSYAVQLTATDAAGNASTRTVSFTLEAAPPTITVANAPANFTNNANIAITGTVTSPDTQFGDTLTLTAQLAGSNAAPLKLALNNGAFTLTAAAIASLAGTTSLADGSYNVQLTATDAMGNTSTKTVSFTLATAATVLNVTNVPPSLTNNPNVAISGSVSTADAKFGDAVTLTAQLGGQNGTPLNITLSNGAFTLTAAQIASISGATSLADGTYAVQLTATDAAGNATTKTVNFTLATAAPVVTITGAPSITNNANLIISGTVTTADAQFGDTVALTAQLAGSTSKLNVALNNGAFTLTAQQLAGLAGTTRLADGVYTVNLTATDAAGNTSTKAVSFTLDTQAPNLSAGLAHDTGVSATDGITSDDTVVGKITDSQNLMVELRAGFDGASPANFSNIALNPDGSFTLTPAQLAAIAGGALADGAHTLHLVACDQAGNLSSFSVSFTLDTAPPALSAGLLSGGGSGPVADDTI